MTAPRTYTVIRSFPTGNGFKVIVRGHPADLTADEPLEEGAAVVIVGNKAERAKS